MTQKRSRGLTPAVGAAGALTALGYLRFQQHIAAATRRAAAGSALGTTARGPVEYAQIGSGKPVLVVHGAGGGYDQGLLCGRPLVKHGFRVIAASRFGYLRTPLPTDASPQAQADAYAALLDTLGFQRAVVIGASAGAPSAMQFAIQHPERCSALVLLVPLVWKPSDVPDSVHKSSPLAQLFLQRVVGSDLLFWLTLRLARDTVIKRVLATPPALVAAADRAEQERIEEILQSIPPLRQRAAGLRNDMLVANNLARCDLENIAAPTLVVSVRDDLFGTFAGAQYTAENIRGAKFIGYEQGGHLWVGHADALLREVASFAGQHA